MELLSPLWHRYEGMRRMKQYLDKDLILSKSQRDYLEKRYDYDDFVLVSDIESILPADVRPVVRGRWVRNNGRWRCDKCTCQAVVIRSPFCPNCGADMRGTQDE